MGLADPSCSPARRHRYGTIVSTCVYIYIYIHDIPDSEIRLFGREGETAGQRDRAAVETGRDSWQHTFASCVRRRRRKSTEEIQGPVRLLETPRSLFPSARLFSQVMARRYGHLELLLTLNNFPGLSASVGESEIISGWNFLYFTRSDRVDVQQRN